MAGVIPVFVGVARDSFRGVSRSSPFCSMLSGEGGLFRFLGLVVAFLELQAYSERAAKTKTHTNLVPPHVLRLGLNTPYLPDLQFPRYYIA